MLWDIFCRVVDNHGDLGVCWRLARDLHARGVAVRLWVDDASALAWMASDASHGEPGLTVFDWHAPVQPPGDVVIEAFGCDPPAAFVEAMACRTPPPRWINLEYLSAEAWVERAHGLPSPQGSGPGRGLVKRFHFPGYTPATGGLLREPGLVEARRAFDRGPWLAAHGWTPAPGERLVSLFCYPQAPIDALPAALGGQSTLLLLCGGVREPGRPWPAGLRCVRVPWLAQDDYDRLLWSCDLNFVRGEDSAVRALWAGAPFVWQLYPQDDGVHALKLAAFAERFGASGVPGLVAVWRRWNGLEAGPLELPAPGPWRERCAAFVDALLQQDDLTTQLLAAVSGETRSTC